jgi:penicillin-binding protein 1A
MKAAHQGVPVAALPGLVGAPSLAAMFPPWGNAAPPAPAGGQAAVQTSGSAPAQGSGQSMRPAPINSGIDGWFLDRLFGRR